MIAILINNVI